MSLQQVDRAGWSVLFDIFTNSLPGKRAEVEMASLGLGDHIEAEWTPLFGLAYHGENDLIEVALDRADHFIIEPHEVYVDFGVGGLIAIEVIGAGGARQILKLKDPLALLPPGDHSARALAR